MIGDLVDLNTADKTSIVNAINEVVGEIVDIKKGKYYVTPEMYGAVGDGVTDDSAAINAALNTKLPFKAMEKNYYIASPIFITSQFNHEIDFSNCVLVYDGIDYAIQINYMDYCDLKIGYLYATNGNGIKITSSAMDDHAMYNIVSAKQIRAESVAGVCLFINPSANGFINEFTWENIQFAQGKYGAYIKNDSPVHTCDQHRFYNCSPEGVDTFMKFESAAQQIDDVHIVLCREHETFNTMYEVVGAVYDVLHVGTRPFDMSWIDASAGTCVRWKIDNTVFDSNDNIYYAGVMSNNYNELIPYERWFQTYSTVENLPSYSTDLNDFKRGGKWACAYPDLPNITNKPTSVNAAFILTVETFIAGNYPIQRIQLYNDDQVWVRYGDIDGSTWSYWIRSSKNNNYVDLDVTLNFTSDNTFYALNPAALSIELLYSYYTYTYKIMACLGTDGLGITFFADSSIIGQTVTIPVRVWYQY